MEKNTKQLHFMIFLTAFIQVCLVAMNTVFISHGLIIPMLVTGFGISLVWTYNVSKVALGSLKDKLIYATGAMTGTGVGYMIAVWVNNLLL